MTLLNITNIGMSMSMAEKNQLMTGLQVLCVCIENYLFFFFFFYICCKGRKEIRFGKIRLEVAALNPGRLLLLYPALGKANILFDLIFLTFKLVEINICSQGKCISKNE